MWVCHSCCTENEHRTRCACGGTQPCCGCGKSIEPERADRRLVSCEKCDSGAGPGTQWITAGSWKIKELNRELRKQRHLDTKR